MAKYFSENEFKCKHCGCLPANGMDKRLLSVLDFARSAAGCRFMSAQATAARCIMPTSGAPAKVTTCKEWHRK